MAGTDAHIRLITSRSHHLEIEWAQIFADCEDLLFPQMNLDPWERTLYLYLLRHTRMKGLVSGLFAVGPLSKSLPISDYKVREVLRSLHSKSCLRIEDRSRHGHLIHVLLPNEMPRLTRPNVETPNVDIALLDFYSGRLYISALLARENHCCFYCLRAVTAASCELDHLVAQAVRLDHSFRNVVVSCHNCNKAKSSLDAAVFLRSRYRANLLSDEELQNRLTTLEAVQSGTLVPNINEN
jgi:5-methylcytosine-specific restriction endonuclease McrA